jgi:hypothetical protein
MMQSQQKLWNHSAGEAGKTFLRLEWRGMWLGRDLDVKALRCEKQGTTKQARTKNRQQQQR